MRRTTAPTPDTETTEELTPTVEQEQATPAPRILQLLQFPKLHQKPEQLKELHNVHPKKMTPSEAIKYIQASEGRMQQAKQSGAGLSRKILRLHSVKSSIMKNVIILCTIKYNHTLNTPRMRSGTALLRSFLAARLED